MTETDIEHDSDELSDDDIGAFAVKMGVTKDQVRALIRQHGRHRAKVAHEAKALWVRGRADRQT